MEIENASNWWYKACKKCYRGLEVRDDKFHCSLYNIYFGYYTPRYCIHMRVMDESDSPSFILWEKEVENFLGSKAMHAYYNAKEQMGHRVGQQPVQELASHALCDSYYVQQAASPRMALRAVMGE
ncbi:hypothetical protein PIB30_064626 [Stylosanthes scabra]|uniref:Replication factor A C-terminal domain-containing protein n=1 Tax=Stylosanthes scabra TaxID=79078 RepID=A0ABU6VP63_9FABA|nr:hypothetical protein [Stylosanthes scabra]